MNAYIAKHLADWQAKGWVPDMRIESGDKTDEPIRTRGWTHCQLDGGDFFLGTMGKVGDGAMLDLALLPV